MKKTKVCRTDRLWVRIKTVLQYVEFFFPKFIVIDIKEEQLCEWDKEIFNIPFLDFFFVALRANEGHGLLILEVSRSHTAHHSL